MNYRIPAAIVVGITSCVAQSDVIMDQLDPDRIDWCRGNAIGGGNLFGGKCGALQICDDFQTTESGYIITQVEVANSMLGGYYDVTDARVSIYPDLGGVPGEEPVYSERVSQNFDFGPASARRLYNKLYTDWECGNEGVWTVVTGLRIRLEPNTSYYICVQVDTGPDHWGYTGLDFQGIIIGSDCYVRDGPKEEGCEGGYGTTEWQAMGERYREQANANYRVVATAQ